MTIRSKKNLKMKKGDKFHLDHFYALMQGTDDLFSQNEIDSEGEITDDSSDNCLAEMDFEIIVIIKTK